MPSPTDDPRTDDARARAAARRRLAETFGEVLPDTTNDDRPDRDTPDRQDRWYRENRPPHHGG